jgi:AraC-like DNA-binding protein
MHPNACFSFSTESVPVKDRHAIWAEVVTRQYMLLDVEPQDESPLRADIDLYRLPSGPVSFIRSTPMRFTRTRQHSARENGDFTLVFAGAGRFRYHDDRQDIVLDENDAVLLCNSNTGSIDKHDAHAVMTMRIDGAALRACVSKLEDSVAHPLRAGNVALKLAVGYVASAFESRPLDPPLDHLVGAHVVDLLAFSLRPSPDVHERAQAGALQAARLAAIRADIVGNLGQWELSAATLARRHGLSERSIYLLFERAGLSLARYIVDERLKRAFAMLHDPACTEMKISDVAFAVGFGDLTTFNRAFRRRYADTPQAVRRSRGTPR